MVVLGKYQQAIKLFLVNIMLKNVDGEKSNNFHLIIYPWDIFMEITYNIVH
jgi:hypothetical protein